MIPGRHPAPVKSRLENQRGRRLTSPRLRCRFPTDLARQCGALRTSFHVCRDVLARRGRSATSLRGPLRTAFGHACRAGGLAPNGTPAKEKLVGKLGGQAPVEGSLGGAGKKAYGISSLALLAMANDGPVRGLPCSGHGAEDLGIIYAAFQLDAERGYRDARLTQKATHFVRSRRGTIAAYDESLRVSANETPDRQAAGNQLDDVGAFVSGWDLDGFPPADSLEPEGSPLFPPGSDLPDTLEPWPAGGDGGLCFDISELCLDLFEGFAAAALADEDAQLIASVSPDCICHDGYDERTEFTAFPDPVRQGEEFAGFPPERGDYRLIFRGVDITDRIINWSTQEIRFTIPAGSHTGSLYLQRFINAPHHGIGRVLSNLCGIPEELGALGGLSPSPRAIIAIVYPPVVEYFHIENRSDAEFTVEACRAVKLSWGIRLDNEPLGQLLPPCATLQVDVWENEQNVLHQSMDPVGHWYHNTGDETTYQLSVRTLIGNELCGETTSNAITITRLHRVYVEAFEPGVPQIIRWSERNGEDPPVLRGPGRRRGGDLAHERSQHYSPAEHGKLVLPGETFALVRFETQQNHGQVTLSARLAEHEDGQLNYEVVEFLTAIALSGGGAKGSFEMGALTYLRADLAGDSADDRLRRFGRGDQRGGAGRNKWLGWCRQTRTNLAGPSNPREHVRFHAGAGGGVGKPRNRL